MIIPAGTWEFVGRFTVLAVLAAVLALAWPVGWRLARRHGCPRAAAVSLVVSVGVILALTITPDLPPLGARPPAPPHYLTQLDSPRVVWRTITAWPAGPEQKANIALYLPVGLFGRLVWRSVPRAGLFGAALTVFVETCQYGIIGRAGSLTDIRNNTLGALLGAVAAAVAGRAVRGTRPTTD